MPLPGNTPPVFRKRAAPTLQDRWKAVQRVVGCAVIDGEPGRDTARRVMARIDPEAPGGTLWGSPSDLWCRVQRRIGVSIDGDPGPQTLARLEEVLGLLPKPKPTLKQKAMKQIVQLFVTNWLPRQLLKWAAGLIPLIGVTTEQISGFTAVVVGLVGLGVEAGFSWLAKKQAAGAAK